MAEFLIQIVIALPIFLLWWALVALVMRAFGVRMPLLMLRRQNCTPQHLTFSQHLWLIGVLYWGCGMWIFTTLGDYIVWKYWGGSAHYLSGGELLFHAILWPLAGLLFGWMTWNTKTANAGS